MTPALALFGTVGLGLGMPFTEPLMFGLVPANRVGLSLDLGSTFQVAADVGAWGALVSEYSAPTVGAHVGLRRGAWGGSVGAGVATVGSWWFGARGWWMPDGVSPRVRFGAELELSTRTKVEGEWGALVLATLSLRGEFGLVP